MKTHYLALATLSLKNLFGLPLVSRYHDARPYGRFGMHERGIHQVILDLNSVRSTDFSVVDGIWAMEGNGPLSGSPVRMETVAAGRNAVAVDRVCLQMSARFMTGRGWIPDSGSPIGTAGMTTGNSFRIRAISQFKSGRQVPGATHRPSIPSGRYTSSCRGMRPDHPGSPSCHYRVCASIRCEPLPVTRNRPQCVRKGCGLVFLPVFCLFSTLPMFRLKWRLPCQPAT